MLEKITLRGMLLFTVMLLVAVYGVLRLNIAVSTVLEAGHQAEVAFGAAHPYNARVQNQYAAYQLEASKAEQLKRPAPGWHPSQCESQTLDLKDYSRTAARAKAASVWPASMIVSLDTPPLPRPFTADCELERSAFAKTVS
jgi:hypothetical protein